VSSRRPYLLKLCSPGSPSLPPLLPLPRLATSGGAVAPCIYRANNRALCGAPRPAQPASFLETVLKLPQPTPATASRRFHASPNACYRCLAVDHHVKDCRDPVRCRRCGGYSHMVHNCRTPHLARQRWADSRSPRNPGSSPPASHGVASPVPVVQPVPSHSASPPPSSLVPQSPCLDSPAQRLTPTLTAPLPPPPREPASEVGTHPQRFGPVRPPCSGPAPPLRQPTAHPWLLGLRHLLLWPGAPFPACTAATPCGHPPLDRAGAEGPGALHASPLLSAPRSPLVRRRQHPVVQHL